MLRLASDADVPGSLIRALRRVDDGPDLERVQDHLPEGTADPDVLAWAAAEGRVLLTRDRSTMIGFARARTRAGEVMPGLIVVSNAQAVRAAVDELVLICGCCGDDELRGRVVFLPLKPGDLPGISPSPEKEQLPPSAPPS
jgi:hypothetical protein